MKAIRHKHAAGASTAINAMLPESALPRPPEVEAYALERITHPKYSQAFHSVMELVEAQRPETLVIVVGPSGAGKSTLAKSIYEEMRSRATKAGCDASVIPAALVGATYNGAPFNWKDLFIRTLIELNEPLVQRGSGLFMDCDQSLQACAGKMPGESMDLYQLRRRLERSVRRRKSSVLIVDEAHHMLIGRSAEQLSQQFETIKSLAQMTGVTIVLVGTYELLAIRDLSSQLVRRAEIVHLGRYDAHQPEDTKGYAQFLSRMIAASPIPFEPTLSAESHFFYQYDLGTPGLTHALILKSVTEAFRKKLPLVTRDIVARHAKQPGELWTLLRDALKGERRMHVSSRDEINRLLLMKPEQAFLALGLAANDEERAPASDRKKDAPTRVPTSTPPSAGSRPRSSPGGGNPKPGTRTPTRDPVGRAAAGLSRPDASNEPEA
jgi:ABC-type branched-subunit amino acid transport system ATPase component